MLFGRPLARRVAAAVTGVVLITAAPPQASAEQTTKLLRAELAQITSRLHVAEEREAAAVDAVRSLERRLAAAEERRAATRAHAADFVRTAYITGDAGSDPLLRLIAVGDASASVEQLEILHHATRSNRVVLEELSVLDRDIRQARAGLDAQRRELTAAAAQLAADGKRMSELLAVVAEREEEAAAKRRKAMAERAAARRTAERASRSAARDTGDDDSTDSSDESDDSSDSDGDGDSSSSGRGGYHCAVGPANSFTDTWGAPRSGGRRHKGTDVFAPYGSPVYAVSDGVIIRTNWGSSSGLAIQLRSVDGNVYFYAHESSVNVRAGQRVSAGQVIGRVGTSGNAAGTSPHVHFELWAGGGSAINPYRFLRGIC